MRINEFILSEGEIADRFRSALYRTTGLGGDPANLAATRVKFLDDFKQELALAQRSARNAGLDYDNQTFAQQYANRYGWTLTPQELTQIKTVEDDPTKLANVMYMIALGQQKGKGQYASTSQAGAGADKDKKEKNKTRKKQPELSITTEQIIDKIEKMKGQDNLDDLTIIAKTAMQILYKQNPTAYTQLYNEIRLGGQKPATHEPEPEDEPTITRGYNESRTRNFSNRHK